ncbi:hypothetical protein [Crocinitomix algicola]|uniref:hypothetical protein n=1 Tax=Crocinitomix algicola TaxID=1740263 RepID=UPI0008308B2F|nr:hypothetical protein [Crocinitomix algicola]
MKKTQIPILISTPHQKYGNILAKLISELSDSIEIKGIFPSFDRVFQSGKIANVKFLLICLDRSIKDLFLFVSTFKNLFPGTDLIIMTFWDNSFYQNRLVLSGAFGIYEINKPIESLIDLLEQVKY